MERSFITIFEELEEPRNEKGLKYPLLDVILLAIYGILCGFTDFTNMAYYLKKRETELTEVLELEKGVPSHDVFSDVFRLLDIEKFMKLFVEWIKEAAYQKNGGHIAIDGKAVVAATKKAVKGNIPYVISAFMCDCGLSIGQKEVGAKTNEITEIPKLLDLIDIKGCTVTIDAIGTQTAIMDKITEKGGHYCLQLKKNQPNAFEAVKLYFEDMSMIEEERKDSYEEKRKDHGRIERRQYITVNDEEDIKHIVPRGWESVKCLGMAILEREQPGSEKTRERHYHVMDEAVSADRYAQLARGHWGIENSLHWVLDIHFGEDRSTAREDNSISNIALLRKIAFNMAKMMPSEKKKTTKKRIIDFMTEPELFKKMVYEDIPKMDISMKG